MLTARFMNEASFQSAALRMLITSSVAAGAAGLLAQAVGCADLPAALGAAGLVLLGFSLRTAISQDWVGRVQTLAGLALAAGLGLFVLDRLAPVGAYLPVALQNLGMGAVLGLTGGLGLALAHTRISLDRVGPLWRQAAPGLVGEMHVLCERAVGIWTDVDCNDRRSPVHRTLEASTLRLLQVAGRWTCAHADRKLPSAAELGGRLIDIEARIADAIDPVARSQYQEVHHTLDEQLQCLRSIGASRERVVARMHHYVAAMERLRFAAINQRSANASRIATEIQPLVENLTRLGQDIDCTSEAIREVE